MYRVEQLLRRMKTILHSAGGTVLASPFLDSYLVRVGNSVYKFPQCAPALTESALTHSPDMCTGSQLKEWLPTIVPAFPHKKIWQFKCLTEDGKDCNMYLEPRAPCPKSYINLSLPNP